MTTESEKHVDNQKGIVVTEAMIDAGLVEYLSWYSDSHEPREMVSSIFSAMSLQAAQKG